MYLSCLITIIFGIASVSAETVLSGRVVDGDSGRPLDGVLLSLNQATTTSDTTGAFSLPVKSLPAHVQLRRLGYADTTIVAEDLTPTLRLFKHPIPLREIRVKDITPVSTAIARLPSFTTVLERAAFEDQTLTLPSLLDRSTGIQIQSLGGTGSFSTISVRGSSSEQVEVYLDDILLNAAVGGGVNLGNLPLANVSRIEVSRGAGGVGNGLGGTVTLRTRDLNDENRTDIRSSWGSFDTRGLTVFSSGASGKARYLTVLDYASSDNNFGFLDDNGTEYNLTDDALEDRANSDMVSGSVLAKASLDLDDQRQLALSQTIFGKRQGIPGISNNQSRSARLKTTHLTTELSFEDRALGPRTRTRQSIFFSRLRETFLDTAGEIGLGRQDNAYLTKSLGHRSKTRSAWSSRFLTSLDTDIRRETYDPTANIQLITPLFASRRWTLGSRLAATLSLADESLTFSGGIDYRHQRSRFIGRNPFAFSPQAPADTNRRHLLGAHLGLRAAVAGPLSLKANIAKSDRAPSFFELFGDRGSVVGNTDLQPERGRTFDIGVRVDTRHAWGEAAYFDQRYTDLIQFAQTSQFISRPINIGSAKVRGLEVSAGLSRDRTSLSGNYTAQSSKNESTAPHLVGNALPGRPDHKGGVRISHGISRLTLTYDLSAESGTFLDQANRRRVESRALHSASVRVRVWTSSSVGVDVSNLTDTRTTDLWGYPLPGRAWSLTYQAEWP